MRAKRAAASREQHGFTHVDATSSTSAQSRQTDSPPHQPTNIPTLGTLLGEGTYGVVYAHTAQDGQPRALKRLKPSRKPHRGVPLAAYREIRALSALKHDNLLRLCAPPRLDAADRSLVLELERADGGTLAEHLAAAAPPLPPGALRRLLCHVARGLHAMHSAWYVHRDLSPSNILVAANLSWAKVADFGTTRSFAAPLTRLSADCPVCKLHYRAPEELLGSPAEGPPADVWSFGAILCEAVLRRPVFGGRELKGAAFQAEQLRVIYAVLGTPTESEWPGMTSLPLWPDVLRAAFAVYADQLAPKLAEGSADGRDPLLLEVARAALLFDPERRCTMEEVLASRFFRPCVEPDHEDQLGEGGPIN